MSAGTRWRVVSRDVHALAVAVLVLVAVACSDGDPDIGVADAGGDVSTDGSTGGTSPTGSGGSTGTGGGDAGNLEQPRLTLVNGVVDAEAISFCFVKVDASGGVQDALGAPTPSTGLDYGGSLAIDEIAGLDFAEDGVQPVVFAGDLSLARGLDCSEAMKKATPIGDVVVPPGTGGTGGTTGGMGGGGEAGGAGAPAAGGTGATGGTAGTGASGGTAGTGATGGTDATLPALRRVALPTLVAGTIRVGRSLLVVATGCLGGPTLKAEDDEEICGFGYGESQPTLRPVVVELSGETAPGKVGLQVVHASQPSPDMDVRSSPPPTSFDAAVRIVENLVFGEVRPRPPRLEDSTFDLGTGTADHSLKVTSPITMELAQPWSEVLARGGVDEVENGSTYALILIGPHVEIAKEKWWQGAALTIVPTAR